MAYKVISPLGKKLIVASEDDVPYVYDDSVYPTRKYVKGAKVGGTLTAGIGHTSGLEPWIGKEIAQNTRDAWFDDDNNDAEKAVNGSVTVPLTQNQFDALASFAFNVGSTQFKRSTLLKKLNKGEYSAVPAELAKWNHTTINGKTVESDGLTVRRAREAALWNDIATVVTTPPEQSGSAVAEPKAEPWLKMDNIPVIGGFLGSGAALVAGNGPFQIALSIIAVAAFGLAAWYFIKTRLWPK